MTALTYLNIDGNSFIGTLPSSLGQMTSLGHLYLTGNSISGSLPSSIGDMTTLTYLHIGSNSLNGALPSSLGQLTSIRYLHLYGNSITGPLPSSIGDMTALTYLNIGGNSLIGTIPSSLGQMTSLVSLYLYGNAISGPVPDSFSSLTKLQLLRGEGNMFTGVYPYELCTMTQLTTFYLTQTSYNECLRPTSAPTSFPSVQPTINLEESALCDFIQATDVTSIRSEWTCADVGNKCSFTGVTCSGSNITRVDLYGDGISGSLPSSIGDMTALTYLSVGSNSLIGTLPSSLGQMTSLSVLALYYNSLTGPLPSSLSQITSIRYLHLYGNSITGPLPSSIGGMTALTYLDIGGNSLIGTIPSSLGQMTSLVSLYLYGNAISGPVPGSFSSLTKLQLLRGEGNMFTGVYPYELCTMTQLTTFYLTQNTYHECLRPTSAPTSFPSGQPTINLEESALCDFIAATNISSKRTEWTCGNVGNKCIFSGVTCSVSNIIRMDLYNFDFAGSLPSSVGDMTGLTYLEIGRNSLIGTLPSSLGQLLSLSYLYIYDNSITGSLPSSIGEMTTLITLSIGYNSLIGTLPLSLCQLTSLSKLRLNDNSITGPLPSSIGDMTALTYLDISSNSLYGTLPSSLGQMTSLGYLHLYGNSVTGPLPSSIGNMTALTYLDIGSNSLIGTLPSSLGQLTSLSYLYLYDNSLTGPLPSSIGDMTALTYLDISSNSLYGTLPSSLGQMTSLGYLHLYGNSVTGPLPSSIGNMTALTYLDIGSNSLIGTLPSSLGQLTSLSYLYLYDNSLTGPLPSSIGDMTALTYLDISSNSLNGALPSSLGQLTSLVELYLSGNSITGSLPDYFSSLSKLQVLRVDGNMFTRVYPYELCTMTQLTTFYLTQNSHHECLRPTSAPTPFPSGQPTINLEESALCDFIQATDVTSVRSEWTCADVGNKCSFSGVTCSGSDITRVSLYDDGISGSLSSSIGDMTALTYLSVGSNSLIGSLPSSLGQMTALTYLHIADNSLAGTLPLSLGQLTSLVELRLYGNFLTGPLPSSIGDMTALTYLHIADNSLNGTLPSSLGQLTSLVHLSLYGNSLIGTLPSSIGDMTALTYLNIGSNSLTGTLPSSLAQLTSLRALRLYGNSLTGPLLSSIGNMTALTYLNIDGNSFIGTLPSSLGQMTSLGHLYLTGNSISGSLPSSIGDMTTLTYLHIGSNSLNGALPSSLGQLTSIRYLHLYGNSITGPLPSSIGDMTALTYLNIGGNSLIGTIPSSLGQMTSLVSLYLYGNAISGPVPDSFSSLTKLQLLRGEGNMFTGVYPYELCTMTQLTTFYLTQTSYNECLRPTSAPTSFPSVQPTINLEESALCDFIQATDVTSVRSEWTCADVGNKCSFSGVTCSGSHITRVSLPNDGISGSLSSSIGDMTALTSLSIRSNSLNGTLPSSLGQLTSLRYLHVYDNSITGPLPTSIGDMTALTYLDIRSNSLIGTLPSSLGQLTSLVELYLRDNSITGLLPSSIGNMTALRYLSIISNSLIGTIPSSFGHLTSLVGLYLSHNSITGPLPDSFSSLTNLQLLSGESNMFTGVYPYELCTMTQLTTFYLTQTSYHECLRPTSAPTSFPSVQPSGEPTGQPSVKPTGQPSDQPSRQPSGQPSGKPTGQPSYQPTGEPSGIPTGQPSREPTAQPSGQPTGQPSGHPSCQPTGQPSGQPSRQPSGIPTGQPSREPTGQPSGQPTGQPSGQPSYQPTGQPSGQPSRQPSGQPSGKPTGQPSGQPSSEPTGQPSYQPTGEPSGIPTGQPSREPTGGPSGTPTGQPSGEPTGQPSCQPTGQPSGLPTGGPSGTPTGQPSGEPTGQPSGQPTGQPSGQPSYQPTGQPSGQPSRQPSGQPSGKPTGQPSGQPSSEPTGQPSYQPTGEPSGIPTGQPSREPTAQPSGQPTGQPSGHPSCQPTGQPSGQPSRQPSGIPTGQPTGEPSRIPTGQPSGIPTGQPSGQSSERPTGQPLGQPSSEPTGQPSGSPTGELSGIPTGQPSGEPTAQPSGQPTGQPSGQPSCQPTGQPSGQPSRQPSGIPTGQPSGEPTGQPSGEPSGEPTGKLLGQPSGEPTGQPLGQPSSEPTGQPSGEPAGHPLGEPSGISTEQPSGQPTGEPSGIPTGQPSGSPTGEPSGIPTGQPSCQPTGQTPGLSTGQPSGQQHSTFPSQHAPLVAHLPEILRMDWTAYRDRVTLSIQLSNRGYVYCASVESMVIVVTVNSVISANNFDYVDDASVNASISITSLTPSTNYTLYCVTQNNDLLATSYEEMLSNAVVWKTLCCKSIYVDLNMFVLQAYSVGWNMVAVTLSAAPSSGSDVWISAEVSNSSGSYTVSPFLDDTVTVAHSSWSKTHFFTVANCAPGLYTLQVTMMDFSVQQEYDVVFRSGQSFTVEPSAVEPSTPRLTSAQFSKSGESAVLKFDSPTDKARYSSYFKCSRLLNVAGASSSDCLWTSATTLTVYFKGPLLPEVGDSVVLLPGQLRAQCTSTSSECTGWATVNRTEMVLAAPYDPISPTLVVTYPKVSSLCDRPVIDITASSGSGGRPWKHFNITVTSASNTVHTVQKWLTENYVISPPPAIPAQLFQGGYRYIFELWLCNFLGECSSAIAIIKRVNDILPYVSMVGKLSRQIFTYTPLTLQSNAFLNECDGSVSYSNLIYDWKIFEGEVEHSELVSLSSDPRKFKLPPYSLNVSSVYEVKLSVTSSLSGLSSSAVVYVSVVQSNIVAIIEGGSQQSLRIGGSVLLDASGSYDKNIPPELRPPAESSGFEFRWTCMQLFPALLLRCDDLNIHSNSITTPHLLHIFTTNKTKEHSEYSISVEVLSIADGRQAESSVVVRVTEALAPIVTIRRSGAASGVNPSSSMVLLGTVQLDVAQSAFWTINEPSVALSSITSTATYVSLAKGLQSVNLVVSAGSIPGRSVPYVFSLTCGSSTASLTVIFNTPPQPGLLAVFPPSGIAWDTVFTLIAESWTDEDLPLSYVLGYVENGHYPIVRSRLETSYASSTFPPGDNMNGYALLCYVHVMDSLDAVSRLQTSVVVRSNTALSATLASEKFRLELESSGNNIELTKQILSLSSSYLNTKNCSSAPNCTSLNRHDCFSVDHTCGSCLAGYVGEEGASNHGCVPESDLLTPSPGVVCGTDDDCSVWEYCKDLESPSVCDYLRKTCTGNCSHRGTCVLQDSDSGAVVSECLLIDSSCEAKCLCDKGFGGLFCEYTAEEARVRTNMREANLKELDGVTGVNDPTVDSILEWQQILVTLTTQPSELSEVGAEHGLNIADVILSNATLQSVDTYEAYSDTLTAVDSIATVSINILLSSLTSSNITRHRSLLFNESSFIASRVASALDTYGSGVRRSLIEGQRGNRILRKSFQQITEVFSFSVNSEDISMAVPQSFAKTSAGLLPSSFQFLRNSTRHPSRSLKVSLSSIRSKLYDNGNYNSDVLQMAIDGAIYTNDSFKIIIQNNYPIYYGRVHANNTTFNVTCDRDVYTTHIIPCHPSVVNVTCNGTAAKVRLRCPDIFSAPHCRVLSTRGNFNCTVDSYTVWNTTCLCRLTSSGYHFGGNDLSSYDTNPSPSQRRVDETGQEQAILRESGYVELVSTSEYVAGDFTATVVLAQEFDSPEDLQAVLLVVSLFGTIWGMGFLAMCYMFATSAYFSKSEKLKQCATTPSLDLNSESPNTISTDSMKMRLHSYVKEVFPAVYNAESPWSRLWRELKSHHRYIALVLSKDYTNTVNHRIRVLLHLLTTLSMLMFFLALLYDFEYPEDNGKCEAHTTASQCATEKSMLDSSQRICQWVEDDDTIGEYSCVFVSPEVSLKAILIASVICSIFSMFGNAIVDFIFDILAAPTACCSRQNTAEQINGQIQWRVSQFGRRVSAITTNLSDQFRSSVGRKRKTSSFITIESTRHLPYSCIAAQQLALSSFGSIVAEVNPSLQSIERRSSRSQRLSRNTDASHPHSTSFQSYYGLCPVSQRSEGVDKVAAIPSTVLSISTDDLYTDLCSDIVEQMRHLRTTRQKDAFVMAWCLGNNGQFKPEYASIIEKRLKEHLAFVQKEVALKRNKLNQIEDIYIGLELLHMFVLDVVGRASPAAKIFETKSEEEFRHTYVVSKFVKGIMWTLVVLLNLCFIFYSMLRGLQRGLEWQMMFLFACILQFLFEILLYESSEVAIIHFVIPSLVRYEVMAAQSALYNAIESISNMSEETNDLILDTPQYLFVSVNVAKFFPHQLESAIVRSYHSLYPGAVANNWKGRSEFYCRRGAVVPSGRTYTRRFSVIALLSLLVQQLGAVSSTWQRMIIHLLQPLFAVSLIMMWQYMWYHPIYFIFLLVLAVYVGYRYLSSWKNQVEERISNKVGQCPALVSPDSSASCVPGEEGMHRLKTDSAHVATEEGHSPHHLSSSDPTIHQQRHMNDFPSIVEVGLDTTIVPLLPATALDPIVAADTDTEGAAAGGNILYGDSSNIRPAEKSAMSKVAHLLDMDFSSDSELECPDLFKEVFGDDYEYDDSTEFEL